MRTMGQVVIKIPLVTWRDGRPRFIPGPTTVALGYKGEDLRHGKQGAWFTLEETIAWSERRQKDLAERRAAIAAGDTTLQKTKATIARARAEGLVTVAQLLTAFRDLNPRMQGVAVIDGKRRRKALSPHTVRNYATVIRLLEHFDDGVVWAAPAEDLTPAALSGVLEKFERKHGLAQTRTLRAMLSVAYNYGRGRAGKHLVSFNPVAELEETLPVLEPRVRYGLVPEMETLIATADALGFPEIGDAVCVGLYTGQRQNDRLMLEHSQITAEGILFQQSKKGGQPLLIPMIAMLRDRMTAATARRREWRLNWPQVLIDERRRAPWQRSAYAKAFRVIRHAAAFGSLERVDGVVTPMAKRMLGRVDVAGRMAAAGVTPMASLADFHDQDLRDTAVTWLALAGCDKWQIAAITGHSLKSIDGILRHYFGAHPDLARAAMAKLEAWRRTAV